MQNWALDIAFPDPDDLPVAAETLADALDECGALGLEERPAAEAQAATLRVFFPESIPPADVIQRVAIAVDSLRSEGVLKSVPHLAANPVPELDWVAEFRKGFRGARIPPGLRILPPWKAYTLRLGPTSRFTTVFINPGQAFGTGLHETTQLCLSLLQQEIGGDERVADLGAGSGILAIAAVKLGARSALAVEIDPQAHENLLENIQLNGVGRRVKMFTGDAVEFCETMRRGRQGFDCIVCNIQTEKIQPILPHLRDLVRRGRTARLIVAGHLWTEREAIAAALQAAGVEVGLHRRKRDWGVILGTLEK